MTAYRFRIKYDPDPTSVWRDVVVGAARPLDEVQSTINDSMGLDQGHLWFVGVDESYWNSEVRYECPQEYEDGSGGGLLGADEETHDAGETSVGDLVDQLELAEGDRICYLYDYGDEWRFYAILKSVRDDEQGDREPDVVDGTEETVDQYGRR